MNSLGLNPKDLKKKLTQYISLQRTTVNLKLNLIINLNL